MRSIDRHHLKKTKALTPGPIVQLSVLVILITAIAYPCVAGDAICIELQYTDSTTGNAVITVRDHSGSATATSVRAALAVAVLDSIVVVDQETDLDIWQLEETTFLAEVPFIAGTVPVVGDGELGSGCAQTIRATYSPSVGFTDSSTVSYLCDGADIIECVGAGIIDQREINLMANSFILNTELMMLQGMLEASDSTSTLKFGTASTDTGWATTLTGTFLGEDLLVTYTGTVDYLSSPDHVFLSYESVGTYGAEDWTGSGLFCWDEDPVSGAPTLITGQLHTDNCEYPVKFLDLEVSLEVAIPVGWAEVAVGVSKNLSSSTLSGYFQVGDATGFAAVGGRMDLNQSTGANQAYVYGEAAWGLLSAEVAVGDQTQAFCIDPGCDPMPDGFPPPRDPDAGEMVYLDSSRPLLPIGASAGTDDLEPGEVLYDSGYIGGYKFLDGPSNATEERLPAVYKLHANYPNPFNPTTTIHYEMPEAAQVRLKIYNIAGRLVRVLVDGVSQDAGPHSAVWDGRDGAGRQVGSGVYFYRFEARGFEQTNRMVLVK